MRRPPPTSTLFPTRRSSDLPARQQTMRAAISWGYNLLDDEEKRLFATLSVFRGGFSIEMAEALSDDCYEVLDGLRSEEHTSELQSQSNLVCRLLLEKKNQKA